jgi:hypothetical protein
MPEVETPQQSPAVTPSATPAAAPVPLVGADGKFSEHWKQALPEDIRDAKCLDIYQDFPGMAKSIVHAQQFIYDNGRPKVIVPDEKSTQLDWDMFHKAIGRPEKPEDYKFERPAELPPEHWNAESADQFKAVAHQIGLTQKQMDALGEFDGQRTISAMKAQADAERKQHDETDRQLHERLGGEYDAKIHAANLFLNKTTDEGPQREALIQLAESSPEFILWVTEWGEKVSEDPHIDSAQLHQSPLQLEDRDKQLLSTPGFLDGSLRRTDPYRFGQILKEREEIATKLTKRANT